MSDPQTRLTKLTFASIDALANGDAAEAVDQAIQRALADLHRYGGDGRARKVVVEVSLRRVPGDPRRFRAGFVAKCVLPTGKPEVTSGYFAKEADTPEGLFSSTCASNPDQLAIPFDPPAAGTPEAVPQPAPRKPSRKRAAP